MTNITKKIEINAGNFVNEINDYIEGSGVKLIWREETFSFEHKTGLFSNKEMVPSKMLEKKVLSLFKIWFKGHLPKYNNVRNCFWPEVEHRFVVCVYDIDRRVHRYKIISTTSTLCSPQMDDILSTFGYKHNSPFKVIRFDKITSEHSGNFDEMGDVMWEAIMQDSERFTVEFDSNDEDTGHYLVDDFATDV